MMRIAFILSEFPALSETFILNQITGMIDRGHTVDLFANGCSRTEAVHPDVTKYRLLDRTVYFPDMPKNVVWRYLVALKTVGAQLVTNPGGCISAVRWRLRNRSVLSQRLLFTAKPFLNRRHYDIIHCHFGQTGLRGVPLKKLGIWRGKLVTTYYGQDVSGHPLEFGRDVYRGLFDVGDLFLVLSERMKQQLIDLGCAERRIRVHHIGVDCERFTLRPRRARGNRPLKILTVARLVEKKGVEYAIRAVANLARSGERVEHNVVGDGPLYEDIERLIRDCSAQDFVHLLGWKNQDEVASLLDDADLLLNPSVTSRDGDEEGTPTVLMEAMASGVPVLTTYHSAIPEFVEDGVTGFLAPERDVDSLVDKLRYVIRHPERCTDVAQAARKTIEAEFNIEKLNDQLVQRFKELAVDGGVGR